MKQTFNNLLLHPHTRLLADNFLEKPSHALLIIGPTGSGKRTLAHHVAANLMGLETTEELEAQPYFLQLVADPGKQEISIASVRQLISNLKLKTPGPKSIKRVVLIKEANTMSHEAQNALLKILEEPSADTVFILTSPSMSSVLPTIVSRSQRLEVKPVSLHLAKDHYKDVQSASSIESAWLLSRGGIGLMHSLLLKDESHPLKEAVKEAKSWLRLNRYERLLALEKFSSRAELVVFLEALSRVLKALQHRELAHDRSVQTQKLLRDRALINQLQKALELRAAVKLTRQHLVLNFKL